MTAEGEVRRADASDGAAIARLRLAWATESSTAPPTADLAAFEREFSDWMDEEGGRRCFWLAEVGREAIGMLNLLTFERMPWPGRPSSRWGYVANVYVAAEHRNRGVGTQLLRACTTWADDAGLVRLLLKPEPRVRHALRARRIRIGRRPDAAGPP